MSKKHMQSLELPLDELRSGTAGITPEFGACLAQAAAVCLDDQGHASPSIMPVAGEIDATATITWESPERRAFRTWNDPEVATEHGAYGIATLLVPQISDYEVVERSRKGTGFDYWLGGKGENEVLFQHKARLEVSGIRNGAGALVEARVRKKIDQTKRSDGLLPAYVVVVEFGTPQSRIAKR